MERKEKEKPKQKNIKTDMQTSNKQKDILLIQEVDKQ